MLRTGGGDVEPGEDAGVGGPGNATQGPGEQLLEQDAAASRVAVRENLQLALEIGFDRWGRMWMCAVFVLLLGMICVLVWSQWVYDLHHDDQCDQPLAFMLRVLYILVAVHAFQREIIRHLLCYSMLRDGPIEPLRVVIFRRIYFCATLMWPIMGAWMLARTQKCSSALRATVRVITLYYLTFVLIAIIVPAFLVAVLLVLIQHGVVRMPRSRNAAPDDLIDQLPRVTYSPELFDDNRPGCYPLACPICLDSFSSERLISRTPCTAGRHAFHTDCLQGWLRNAHTCPLCRADLTGAPGAGDEETGIELSS
uniref:RING-type domain-containing protein n=1 Tax=Alexandrium monilatum TaxID=311494 RepID=A0A7S4VFX2_9DINO|mmetsp:Transcript_10698/g.32186  ORF Transcript_10698/g.32186 Transcript_10698/m.32186 type:complete len:310 (-) Transcript_10698:56-985(-)